MADMQTALKQALSKAPSPLVIKPLSERIWLYLKDHPGTTSKRLAIELRDSQGSISSMLSQLCRRKMLTWQTEPVKPYKGRGAKHRRVFFVDPKMGGVYELLPEVVKSKPRTAAAAVQKYTSNKPVPESGETKPLRVVGHAGPEITTPTLTIKPQIVTIAKSAEFIDGLTVAEARALYQHLHKMFGEKA